MWENLDAILEANVIYEDSRITILNELNVVKSLWHWTETLSAPLES